MAAALGMSLLDFYRKVFITPDMDNQDNGQAQSTHGLRPALEKAAAEIGYEGKYHAAGERTLPDGRLHGIGIHAHNDRHGTTTGTRGCIINVHRDGTATFNSGGTRMSGGPEIMKAIIAETIGLRYDQVHVATWGNPDASADGGSQAGSTHTPNAGSAAQVAAWDVREQLFAAAAEELGVNPEDLDARLGEIFVMADPTQSITHGDAVSNVPRYSRPVIGKGVSYGSFLRKPVGNHEIGEEAWHRTGIAAAYEVAVDPDTGEVEVLDYVNVCDAGRVINRWGCEGQILTGQASQWGKAFLWDVQHDPGTGTLLSQNLIDDKMATSKDVPIAKNKGVLLETIGSIAPYGCHGFGEPAAVPGYAALINAINNALGVQIIVRPITPQVILKALGKA
jgi:CO/xanthine dehydrogenase Mo-binding subunit